MLGAVESVVLPEVGAAVTPVVMNIALCNRERALQFAAPVTGEVVEVNRKLLRNPGLAHRDPYGAGWLMKVKADRDKGMAARFTTGAGALQWLKEQTVLAKEFLGGVMTQPQFATLQDGGAPAEGILKECDASVWKEFERRFTGIPEPERTTK
jgi:glycine cleavage system H lipoate-binding protein